MKKFGKLRQWTDEKLGGSQKTVVTEEFREMEAEIQTRNTGLEAIHAACSTWMRSLSKKKEGQDKEKGVPVELLGIALFQHGEEFAQDSAYGQALTKLGITQQKLGRAQEAFQSRVSETVMTSMERSLAQMKEFQAARKKLESRRLTYDSALSKCQKAKREDSKVEEELRLAKVRYEEVTDDVYHRMLAIRDAEVDNLNDIGELIEAEWEYFDQSRDLIASIRETFHAEIGMRDGTRRRSPMTRTVSTSLERVGSQQSLERGVSAVHDRTQGRTLSVLDLNRINSRSVSSEDVTYKPPRKQVIANFAFTAERPTELSLHQKDIIEVLEEVSEGWWQGVNANGEKGLFPSNYCSVYKAPPLAMTFPRMRPPPPPVPKKKKVPASPRN